MHVGVSGVRNIGRGGVAGVDVFITIFSGVVLVNLFESELFNDVADAFILKLILAYYDIEVDNSINRDKFVDRDLLFDFLHYNSGFHLGNLNVVENVFVFGQLNLFHVRYGDGGLHNRGVGDFLSHSLHSIGDLGRGAAAFGGAASASRLSGAGACCRVARAAGHGDWDSDLSRDSLIPDLMGDLVVSSHSLLKLSVGLLDSANLECFFGVGNHDSSLDLTGFGLPNCLHNHLGVGSLSFLCFAVCDTLGNL